MKKAIKFLPWVVGLLVLPVILFTASMALAESPIKITLVSDKTSYGPNEPIWIQVRVSNTTDANVITRYGFFEKDFHLDITFTDPDGKPVTTRFAGTAANEGGPPYRYKGKDGIPVEIIPPLPEGQTTRIMNNARDFYDLLSTGWYTAEVRVPLETFTTYEAAHEGLLLAPLDDPGRKFYSPLKSNKIRFEIAALTPGVRSSINVKVSQLTIGGDGPKPGATKKLLGGVPVRLIPTSNIPENLYPINYKSYPQIWEEVGKVYSKLTDSTGMAKFVDIPKDDYVVIALYDESQDFRHTGSPIPSDHPDWVTAAPIEKYLMVIEKNNGKKLPAKTTKLKGSELLITEPEYVTWDSTQETYPFIFESVGDWGVVTEVIPPVGFVSDNDTLNAEVNNELEAVQFTITDVGTEWKSACAKHNVTHKKNKLTLYSRIGINLTKKLADEKGIDLQALFESERENIQETSQYCNELEQERNQWEQESKQETPPKGKKK